MGHPGSRHWALGLGSRHTGQESERPVCRLLHLLRAVGKRGSGDLFAEHLADGDDHGNDHGADEQSEKAEGLNSAEHG